MRMRESREPIISVRDPKGRLEGIVLLPPQATLIRESSFSKVKVCAVGDETTEIQNSIGTLGEQATYPNFFVI